MDKNKVKVEVYIPKTHQFICRDALNDLGVLRIGDYDMCIAITDVTGNFRPLEDSNPYEGTVGELTCVKEVKLEFSCFEKDLTDVIATIIQVHPYEEPVYRIIPLLTFSK